MIAESSICQMDDSAAISFTNESRKKTNKQTNNIKEEMTV